MYGVKNRRVSTSSLPMLHGEEKPHGAKSVIGKLFLVLCLVGTLGGAAMFFFTESIPEPLHGPTSVHNHFKACDYSNQLNFWGDRGKYMAAYAGLPPHRNRVAQSPLVASDGPLTLNPKKICILSRFDGVYTYLEQVTRPNMFIYASRHDYSMFYQDDLPGFHDTDGPIQMVMKLLKSHPECEWAFWMTPDSYFNRFDLRLGDYVHNSPSNLIFAWDETPLTCDANIRASSSVSDADMTFMRLEGGHWFARNNAWTMEFLQNAESMISPSSRVKYKYWYDQGALAEGIYDLPLSELQQEVVSFYHLRSFNSRCYALHSRTCSPADFILQHPSACKADDAQGRANCQQMIMSLMEDSGVKPRQEASRGRA